MKYDAQGRVVGCGYCKFEKTCDKHNPKINQAKLGCEEYKHFSDGWYCN